MAVRGVSLTTRIFLGTAAVVAAVLGATLFVTARSAARTANAAVNRALEGTRAQVTTQLESRQRTLRGQAQTFVQGTAIRSFVEQRQFGNVADQATEAVQQTGATWVQVTDAIGVRLAKSDDPGAPADTLSGSALICGALE